MRQLLTDMVAVMHHATDEYIQFFVAVTVLVISLAGQAK
jgi:hypothetical protein